MDYKNDDELLEWDMEIDENFEDALDENGETYTGNKSSDVTRHLGDRWASTRDEDDQPFQERWSGDGHSEDSVECATPGDPKIKRNQQKVIATTEMKVMNENADRLNYLAESPIVEGKWASFMSKDSRPNSSAAKNSFSAFSPARDDGGKFQILDDDDTDITSYDIPAMEFRGSLKTPEYKPGPSCFCIAFRYIAIVLLCFTVGLAVGYLAGYHQMVCYQVTEKPPIVTSIRNIIDNTTSATKIQKETLTTTIGLPGGNNFL